MHHIDSDTRVCGVIGHPVGHSLSPVIHNAAFKELGLNFVYLAFDVSDVQACLAGFRAIHGFRGLSVTIPHKRAVIPLLDEIEPDAAAIGSVNTIAKNGDLLYGTSTDGPGTLEAFRRASVDLSGKRCLFLGSGGAVRAVAFTFARRAAVTSIKVLGRTAVNVQSLASDLAGNTDTPVTSGDLDRDLAASIAEADVIVQGTPVGMHGTLSGGSIVPASMLRPDQVVFDMVYRPRKTQLLEDAERAGCTTIAGIEMLLHQAALQFERWTGKDAPLDVMRDAVRPYLD